MGSPDFTPTDDAISPNDYQSTIDQTVNRTVRHREATQQMGTCSHYLEEAGEESSEDDDGSETDYSEDDEQMSIMSFPDAMTPANSLIHLDKTLDQLIVPHQSLDAQTPPVPLSIESSRNDAIDTIVPLSTVPPLPSYVAVGEQALSDDKKADEKCDTVVTEAVVLPRISYEDQDNRLDRSIGGSSATAASTAATQTTYGSHAGLLAPIIPRSRRGPARTDLDKLRSQSKKARHTIKNLVTSRGPFSQAYSHPVQPQISRARMPSYQDYEMDLCSAHQTITEHLGEPTTPFNVADDEAKQKERDLQRLEQLGYSQVLGRDYGFWANFSVGFVNIGVRALPFHSPCLRLNIGLTKALFCKSIAGSSRSAVWYLYDIYLWRPPNDPHHVAISWVRHHPRHARSRRVGICVSCGRSHGQLELDVCSKGAGRGEGLGLGHGWLCPGVSCRSCKSTVKIKISLCECLEPD